MPERFLEQVGDQSASDVRFQFEIIKGLAESVREQTKAILRMQEQQTDIVARLERIEAKETAEQLSRLTLRVEVLEATDQRRQGASGVIAAIMKAPVLGWAVGVATAIWAIATGRLEL
jgi:uncharacterized coiled-coil protein SlyX